VRGVVVSVRVLGETSGCTGFASYQSSFCWKYVRGAMFLSSMEILKCGDLSANFFRQVLCLQKNSCTETSNSICRFMLILVVKFLYDGRSQCGGGVSWSRTEGGRI